MVGKYNEIEKNTYKRMFKNAQPKLAIENVSSVSGGGELIMAEKKSLDKSRDLIIKNLR